MKNTFHLNIMCAGFKRRFSFKKTLFRVCVNDIYQLTIKLTYSKTLTIWIQMVVMTKSIQLFLRLQVKRKHVSKTMTYVALNYAIRRDHCETGS